MKNFFKTAIAVIAIATISFSANAQEKGDMAAGAKFVYGSVDGYGITGFGAKFQYNVMDPLRLDASFTYFLPKKVGLSGLAETKTSWWDASVNAHWLFRLGQKVNVYPLAGLGILGVSSKAEVLGISANNSASNFGFNIGGGIDFFLSESMFLNAEAKYMMAEGNMLMLSAGIGFAF